MSLSRIAIDPERPDQPDVIALIKALDDLQLALYPAESNHLVDIDSLLDEHVEFLVARMDGVAVGCGAVLLYDDYGEIKRMMVAPDARGHGLGARVVAALEVATLSRGRSIMRLETGIHQPDAIRLYEKTGYVKRGPFGEYPNDPLSVFMEKHLT